MRFNEKYYSIIDTAEELSRRLGIPFENAKDTMLVINRRGAKTPDAVADAVVYICDASPREVVDTLRNMGWWNK